MRCFLLLALVSFAVRSVPADEPGAGDFDRIYAQWKDIDGQLEKIIAAYQSADAEKRKELLEQYKPLVQKSRDLLPALQKSSMAKYRAEPNADERVTNIVVGLLANAVRADKYEEALRIGDLLVQNECPEAAIDSYLGVAAYNVDDFEKAQTHLKKAEAAKSLTQDGHQCLTDLVKALAAWKQESQLRKKEAAADDLPRVLLETSKGPLVVELYENEAPQAVGNFVSLVEAKFYDGLTFHRVLPGFMAQGGCPTGTGTGGPGYKIYCECQKDDHRKHFRGTLSMAHAGQDTGGSQFFLTFKRTSHLDGRHTVFGRVIKGLDILADLQRIDPSRPVAGVKPDTIVKAEVIRKRDHKYSPTKVK